MKINLYPHQQTAVEHLRSGSILCGGVGSGKSMTSLAYYFCHECKGKILEDGELQAMTRPKDLYIITTARKRDTCEWDIECARFGLSKDPELMHYGITLVIDSWNNIDKYVEVSNAFFIFDEQRVVGKGKWVKAFLRLAKKNHWILLSATPGDTWSDYIPVFIANGYFKNRTEFLKKHAVFSRYTKYPKIERYVDTGILEKYRKSVLVPMRLPLKHTRHYEDIFVEYDKTTIDRISKDRWNVFEEKPLRNANEMCLTMRKVVNSNPSRLDAVTEILEHHQRAIVFYNFDYELEILRNYLTERDILWAEWNGHLHQPLPVEDRWVYLVQYSAGAEGWNCIKTNAIIFYSLNYSYKIMEQAAGRIDRLNSPYADLYYYRLRSRASIDQAIFRAIKTKMAFSEKGFAGARFSQ